MIPCLSLVAASAPWSRHVAPAISFFGWLQGSYQTNELKFAMNFTSNSIASRFGISSLEPLSSSLSLVISGSSFTHNTSPDYTTKDLSLITQSRPPASWPSCNRCLKRCLERHYRYPEPNILGAPKPIVLKET